MNRLATFTEKLAFSCGMNNQFSKKNVFKNKIFLSHFCNTSFHIYVMFWLKQPTKAQAFFLKLPEKQINNQSENPLKYIIISSSHLHVWSECKLIFFIISSFNLNLSWTIRITILLVDLQFIVHSNIILHLKVTVNYF